MRSLVFIKTDEKGKNGLQKDVEKIEERRKWKSIQGWKSKYLESLTMNYGGRKGRKFNRKSKRSMDKKKNRKKYGDNM